MGKMSKDDLGTRQKENYEKRTRTYLPRRTNTLIRLDGKAFHTFTKGYKRPFDDELIDMMNQTTLFLCENIQGVVFGYTQSDEITLVLQDYDKLGTDAWYDGAVQKIVSVSASMATGIFNQLLYKNAIIKKASKGITNTTEDPSLYMESIFEKMAFFDARVFTIPERTEVINNIIWRQQDCVLNSISMVAQSMFSHKELHKKSANEMQEMMFQKGQNWNDLDVGKKRGRMVLKEVVYKHICDKVGKSLIKKEDERVTWNSDGYTLKVDGWKIRDAIDFNKNFELFDQYLQLRRNNNLF